MQATDTIVALSTPSGRSGIGVIRLSGPDALSHARTLLDERNYNPDPNRVALKSIRDLATGEVLDRALVTFFKSPHSYTGEDVLELSCHGSPPLLLHILDALLSMGARTADPGEFTMRALANGRLNLTQAEAVRDLIDARTNAAVRLAARQLGGELSSRLQPIKSSLLEIIVPLESSLEFVEDDLPLDLSNSIAERLSNLANRVESLAETFKHGRLLKEGLKVALVGRPNVGKSSVFNMLVSSDRAIVTDIPGTTRDTISEVVNIKNVPVHLTDTAGVRESPDEIERMGIERTRRAIVDSDLIIVVLDGTQPLTVEDEQVLSDASVGRHIVVQNKCDLMNLSIHEGESFRDISSCVVISAKTGHGFESLCNAILEPFAANDTYENSFVITSARHYDLLRRTADSIRSSELLLQQRASEEIILVGLYEALRFLGEITGETTPDDVLSQIFSTFCIGK